MDPRTRTYLPELVGTFLFMSIGYASVGAFGLAATPGLLVVPFSFGFGLLAAIAIPLTLFAIHFASASLSGASVNPARSIGSAVVSGDLGAIWIYLVGPIVGAVLGWFVWRLVDGGEEAPAA